MFLSIILATPPPSHGAIYIAGGFKKKIFHVSTNVVLTIQTQQKNSKIGQAKFSSDDFSYTCGN